MFFDRFVKYDGKVEPLTIDDYKILSDELIRKYDVISLQKKIHIVLLDIENKQMKYEDSDGYIYRTFEREPEKYNTIISKITENEGCTRAELSIELDQLYIKFKYVYDNKFSYIEKSLFMQLYILKRSGNSIRRILHIAYPKFQNINNSILIKLGRYLNWEEAGLKTDFK